MHLIHVYVIGLHKKITAAQVFFFNLNVYKAIFHSNWGEDHKIYQYKSL